MRNPLQEQLLKAGLVNKTKAAQVVREQAKQRQGKQPTPPSAEQREVQRLQAERAERDRALAAGRNALVRAQEQQAQARQLIAAHKVKRSGDIAYRFTDGMAIRQLYIDVPLRAQLASGTLVIARFDDGYELLPRAVADKVYERDASLIVLDHARTDAAARADATTAEDAAHYEQFQVPDDLIW